MRVRLFAALALCVLPLIAADAQENVPRKKKTLAYRGFIGGMMIHSGYVSSKNATFSIAGTQESRTMRIKGVPAGIGGAIKLMFGKHLRIGGEGYVSNLTYGDYGSHANIGWGGILADGAWRLGKWNLFAGGLFGGGSARNVTLLGPAGDDYVTDNVSYRKYGFLAAAPFAGAEYAVGRRINIVMKIDYVFNLTNPQDDFVTGPRIFLGFMFGHSH